MKVSSSILREEVDQSLYDYCKSFLNMCINRTSLENGRLMHDGAIQTNIDMDISIGKSVLNMYIKCGSMDDALATFMMHDKWNTVMWNAMISGYCKNGSPEEALQFFWKMKRNGKQGNDVTYLNTFKACAALGSFAYANLVYLDMIENSMELDVLSSNTLIDAYAKCARLSDAYEIFSRMPIQSTVSLNVMISALAHDKQYVEAFNLFQQILLRGLSPDNYTLAIIMGVCGDAESLLWGKYVHDYAIQSGVQIGLYVTNSILMMYMKCHTVDDAKCVFDMMTNRDLISWNMMIAGYVLNDNNCEALNTFQFLTKQASVHPDQATFVSSLKACVSLGALNMGKKIHAYCIESGENTSLVLLGTLVDMYIKNRAIEDARNIFNRMHTRNVAVWNVLISSYSDNVLETLKLYEKMIQDGFTPDEVTLLSILKACHEQSELQLCRHIHCVCVESGHDLDLYVGSTLVDVYTACGSLQDAAEIFYKMANRSIVSWNTMIGGCSNHGYNEEALELFQEMIIDGILPDEITSVSIINACANLAELEEGKRIHSCLLSFSKMTSIFVGNALINMYGRCGCLVYAAEAFHRMPEQDIVSWNALISGYAQHGYGKQVLQFAKSMESKGFKFNNITMVGILTACNHTGMLEEALMCFDLMLEEHGIIPTEEHYACIVDGFGRAGVLDAAVLFIIKMPVEPTPVVWMALLGACRIYSDPHLASFAAQQVLTKEPFNSAAVCLMSSLNLTAG